MATLPNDFKLAVDFTGTPNITAAFLNDAQQLLKPEDDRGMVVTTEDSNGLPVVPTLGGLLDRLKLYTWRRVTALDGVIGYFWDPNTTDDPIYQRWRQYTAVFPAGSVTVDRLATTVAGFGLNFSSANGLQVKISVSDMAGFKLIDATKLPDGTIIQLQGYYTVGDGGEGFYTKKTGTVINNDGRYVVYSPGGIPTTSYWERIVIVNEDVRPEWFGAKGDGITNDVVAIKRCIETYNRCDFGAKTYLIEAEVAGTYSGLTIYSNTVLTGKGMDVTTIKLQNNAQGAATGFYPPTPGTNGWFTCINCYDVAPLFTVSNDNVYLTGFTLDCNWQNQAGHPCTINGISINGVNNLVEKVRVINQGVGAEDTESWGIFLSQLSISTTKRGNIIRYCEATSPQGMATTVAEISVFAINAHNATFPADYFNNLNEACEITGCHVYDMRRTATMVSPIHVISVAGVNGCRIADNKIINVDGVGVYFQNYHNNNVTIENNNFTQVINGVVIIATATLSGIYIVDGDMWMKNCTIRNNLIILTDTITVAPPLNTIISALAINIFYGKNSLGADYDILDNLLFENNYIYGKSFVLDAVTYYPRGIYFTAIGQQYKCCFRGNIIEIPDSATTAYEWSIICVLPVSYNPARFISIANQNVQGDYCKTRLTNVGFTLDSFITNFWYNYKNTALPSVFPPNMETIHYDATTKRIYVPTKLATLADINALVPGRTYVVIVPTGDPTLHADYDDGGGGGIVSYYNNQTFVATTGYATCTVDTGAYVYEHYIHHWKEIGQEKDLSITAVNVGAGLLTVTLSLNGALGQLEGIIQVNFDGTDNDKTIIIPDPLLTPGRTIRIVGTSLGNTTSKTIKVVCTGKLISSASPLAVNELTIATSITTTMRGSIQLFSDGTNWYSNQ